MTDMQDHPNIVNLHEIWESPETCSLVTEFCVGGDLLDFANKQGLPMHESAVFTISSQLLRALKYMHGRGVIHADIKLENVLLPEENSIESLRLIDFGLSYKKLVRDDLLKVTSGTLSYMAPEMLRETQQYDVQCDMWSMGVLIFILATGQMPFQGE